MEGMSKLTETSSLVLSDFKRINQGLPVLFLLQTTYHSYTKHYWPAHFLCVYSYSFSDTVIFWMEAYFSLARYVQYILYNGCRWFRRCIGCEFMILLLLLGFFFFPSLFTPACGFSIPQNFCFCSAKPCCWQKRWCFLAMACCGRGGLQNCFKAVRFAQ